MSPLWDWFMDTHTSKWSIGEQLETARNIDPRDTVLMIRGLEDGARDPSDPDTDNLWEFLEDYCNLPMDLRTRQAEWYVANGGGR